MLNWRLKVNGVQSNSKTGRATCNRLDINDERRDEPSIQIARRLWIIAGWHPPKSDPRL